MDRERDWCPSSVMLAAFEVGATRKGGFEKQGHYDSYDPESFEKSISVRNCLDQVGLRTHRLWGLSSLLMGVGRTGSPWATPFPRQNVLNCLRRESELRASSTQECTRLFSLLLAVDGCLRFPVVMDSSLEL